MRAGGAVPLATQVPVTPYRRPWEEFTGLVEELEAVVARRTEHRPDDGRVRHLISLVVMPDKEGGMEGGADGGMEGGTDGGMEGGTDAGTEGGTDGGTE